MEARVTKLKKITTAEFDEKIRQVLAAHNISRRTNFLLYTVYSQDGDLTDEQIERFINGNLDITFDEASQNLVVPLPKFLPNKITARIFDRRKGSLDKDLKVQPDFSDIVAEDDTCLYFPLNNLEVFANELERGCKQQGKKCLAKFQSASDNMLLHDAIAAVSLAFAPFDKASLRHMPAADSDLEKVMLFVTAMRNCFDHLPDKNVCEFNLEELAERCNKFESLIHRLLPFSDEKHPFAQSNPEEFKWLVELKKAGEFYKANCATTRIFDAMLFQDGVSKYLNGHAVKPSEFDNIFGRFLADSLPIKMLSHAYYAYKPTDPAYIYLYFHMLEDQDCQAVRESLLAMDQQKKMQLFDVGVPSTNAGYYEVKVKSTDALNVLLPRFKANFDKVAQEQAERILPYIGQESPKPNRKCPIAFFDPASRGVARQPQHLEGRRHRKK